MNFDLIGKENLPNVYFDSIIVDSLDESREQQSLKITCYLKLYDALDKDGVPYFSPYKNKIFRDIVFFVSTSQELTEFITNGGTPLFNIESLKKVANKYEGKHMLVPCAQINREMLDRKKESELNFKTQFVIDSSVEHVCLFAAVTKMVGRNIENGPVFSELVMTNKKIIKTGYYLVNETGAPWNGPVHRHPDRGFMQGSFHSDAPHSFLQKVQTINTKIKDNRKNIEQKSLDSMKKYSSFSNMKNHYFSNLFQTQNEKYGLNFLFSINTYQTLKNLSSNKRLSKINQDSFYDMVKSAKIKKIAIYYNTKSDSSFKPAIFSKQTGNTLDTKYSEYLDRSYVEVDTREEIKHSTFGIIEELVINERPEIRHFNCQINSKDIKQIKVKVSIQDPTIDGFKAFKSQIELASSRLKTYYTVAKKRNHYDREKQKIKQMFISNYYSRIDLWMNPIKTFKKVISLHSNMKQSKIDDLVDEVFMSLNPKTATLQSMEKAISKILDTFSQFKKTYNLDSMQNNSRTKDRGNNLNIAEITISKTYDVNHKVNPRTIELVSSVDQDGQIPILRVSQFQNTIDRELQRFSINIDENITDDYDETLLNQNTFHLSPKSIIYKQSKFKVFDIQNINEEAIENFVQNSTKPVEANFSSSNLLITRYANKESELVDPTKTLGEDSPFNQNLDTETQLVERRLPKNIKTFKKFNKRNLSNQKKAMPLLNKQSNNILKIQNAEQNSNLAIHIKDFVLKDNILNMTKEEFIKNNPYKKDVLYDNLYKVYIINDFIQDTHGNMLMNYSEPEELTLESLNVLDRPVICTLLKDKNQLLADGTQELSKYKPINSFFIIAPNDWNYQKELTIEAQDDSLERSYNLVRQYINFDSISLRTNVVNQREERMPVKPKKPKSRTNRQVQQRNNNNQVQSAARPNRRSQQRPLRQSQNRTQQRNPRRTGGRRSGY